MASNNNVNASGGALGPVPPDFPGFESTNAANVYDGISAFTDTAELMTDNKAAFTICGWFNASGPAGLRIGLFGQNDATEFGFQGQDPYAPTGEGELGIWTPNGGAAYLSQTNINPGQWYFTAATGDGTNLSLYLYTTNGGGGAQVAFSTASGSTTNYGAGAGTPFHIGGGGILDPTGNYFAGDIDEVAVWYRGLSMGELTTLFAAGIGVSGIPPQITAEPAGGTLYAGRTMTLSVTALGSAPLHYEWLQNGAAHYRRQRLGRKHRRADDHEPRCRQRWQLCRHYQQRVGSATSSVVAISVITPPAGGYAAATIAMNPLAYYRLNETTDPTTGTAIAYDYVGGYAGSTGPAARTDSTASPGRARRTSPSRPTTTPWKRAQAS